MTSVEERSAGEGITVIEEHMLDRKKFYPFILANSLMMRAIIHPFNFVRVRQQVQKSRSLYNGTFHAFYKIGKTEGLRAFTKGGFVNCVQIIPSFVYVNLLEKTKSNLKQKTRLKKGFVIEFLSGGTASLISSVISLPLDIAYQHLIIDGQVSEKDARSSRRICIPEEAKQRRFGALRYIYNYIYETEGLIGLWKGSFISIAFYSFNSGLWWTFYSFYRDQGVSMLPNTTPIFLIQACSGAFAGHTGAFITNWIDVIRVSVQTEINTKSDSETGSGRRRNKIVETAKRLWAEEGYKFMFKGLTARLMATSIISPLLIGGYELVKRISLKEEYKENVRR